MYLLLGTSHMEHANYEGAIRLFESAQARLQPHQSQSLLVISLASFSTGVAQSTETVRVFLVDIRMEI